VRPWEEVLNYHVGESRRMNKAAGQVIFHYTSIYRLADILRRRRLELHYGDAIRCRGGVERIPESAAAVWCSTDPLFELACNAAYLLRLTGPAGRQAFRTLGAVTDVARIVLPASAAPYRWKDWWRRAGVPDRMIDHFGEHDRHENGSDWRDWRVSPNPIPARLWLEVQIWDAWRLTWIPLQQTDDRMIGELVRLLPARIRRAPADVPDTPGLPQDVRDSPVSLLNVDKPLPKSAEHVDEDYFEYGYDAIPAIEDHCRAVKDVRDQWLAADLLARAGVAVFPCDTYEPDLLKNRSRLASRKADYIDYTWLLNRLGDGIGIVFGARSPGIFGLRLRGQARLRGARSLPRTIALEPCPCLGKGTLFLYRAPPGILEVAKRCPGELLAVDHEQLLGGKAYSEMLLRGTANVVAQAPNWLLDWIRSAPGRRQGGPDHHV